MPLGPPQGDNLFGDEQAGRGTQPDGVGHPDVPEEGNHGQTVDGPDVACRRADTREARPEARGNRLQALRPVDLDVLERVEYIEARHPEGDGACDQEIAQVKAPRHAEEPSHRCRAAGEAQPEVGQPGETLGVGIAEHEDGGERQKRDAKPIEHRGRHAEERKHCGGKEP